MVPAEDSVLPDGSLPEFVADLRQFVMDSEARGVVEGGTVTLVLEGQITGVKAWGGTPMFVVMEYFGMPYEPDGYHALIHTARETTVAAITGAAVFVSPKEPRRMAVIQSQDGMTLEQAEEFLRNKRS